MRQGERERERRQRYLFTASVINADCKVSVRENVIKHNKHNIRSLKRCLLGPFPSPSPSLAFKSYKSTNFIFKQLERAEVQESEQLPGFESQGPHLRKQPVGHIS